MKTRNLAAYSLILLYLTTAVYALSPLPPKSIEERVMLASHVFVAKIVEARDFPSEDSMISFGHVIYKVKLENLIWPQEGWYSHDIITIRGIYGIEFGGEHLVGKSRIFIVSKEARGSSVFTSPHGRETSVSVDEKSDVIRAIIKKKEKPQPPNQRLQTMRFKLPMNAIAQGPHV
jgi:hypothetical protein